MTRPDAPFGQAFSAVIGPPGSTVNITLDSTRGAFTLAHTLMMNEKQVTPTILNGGYLLQLVVPDFQNHGPKDINMISPNELVDSRANIFTVTAP